MTINSIVYVPEGIVIAADSRLTGTNISRFGSGEYCLSDNMQKIFIINKGKAGLTFNGKSNYNDKTISIILKEFDENELNENDSVVEIANKFQEYMLKNFLGMDTHFWIAGYNNDEPYVFHIVMDKKERRNIDNSGNLDFSSISNGTIDIVSALNKAINPNFRFMPLKDAINFAEFYIDTTIKGMAFNEGYSNCGGPIDILVITQGRTSFYKHKLKSLLQ